MAARERREHIYAGGLWLGAVLDGAPHVSSALYRLELLPAGVYLIQLTTDRARAVTSAVIIR